MKGTIFVALLAPIAMFVEVMMDLMQPTYMSDIINVGVADGDVAYILDKGKMMLIVALIGALGGMACSVFSTIASMRFGTSLRQATFDKIQTFSFKEIDKFSTSSLITRLTNDITQLQNLVMMGLRMLVRAPLHCIGGLIMAYILSPQLALIFIAAVPVLFVSVFFILRKAFPMFSEMQKKIDRVNTVMRENLLGVRVVKAFVGQDKEKERFDTANKDLMDWSVRASTLMAILSPIVTLIMNVSVVALFWFGGNMAVAGNLEAGTIMAFMTYLTQALMSLMMVVMMMMNLSRAKASADRINEVLDTESSIRYSETPKTVRSGSVEFDHVFFSYGENDKKYVLNDITFKAEEGQTIGVIGSTGSGKSTLVSLISRLYDVNKGTIRIGGVDIKDISREDLHKSVGMVMQESLLFSGTVRENLRWADEHCDFSVIEKAVAEAQAQEFLSAHKDGYDAAVEQRGKNFSGGQKQRLSIARTFARRPKILILDDSTSAVDTSTESKIHKAISEHSGNALSRDALSGDGQTVFIIAQRISAVRNSDQIIVLDEGSISGIGTHADLIKNNEIYRSIAVSQLGEEAVANAG